MPYPLRQCGATLIAVIVLIVVIALMVSTLGYLYVANERSASLHGNAQRAYYAARSGLEYAQRLYDTGIACGAGLNATNAVGSGSFTTSGATLYNLSSSVVAAGGVTASQTTIPVTAMGAYAPYGRIVIDSEEMYYGGITGTTFTNVKRGISGTVAAAHSAGDPVRQHMCRITSTGTVATAVRILQMNMPPKSYVQGSFTKRTSVGSQTITGLPFQPRAVIFFWTRQTAASGFNSNSMAGFGFVTATGAGNATGLAISSSDAAATSDAGSIRSDTYPIMFTDIGATPTPSARALLASMNANGFTLTWSTDASIAFDTNAYRIHYIALGNEITNAASDNLTVPITSASAVPVDFPLTGLGFAPDFVLFAWQANNASYTGSNLASASATHAELGIGFCAGANIHAATVFAERSGDGPNTDKRWGQRTDRTILFLDRTATPPAFEVQGTCKSLDADGMTVTVTTRPVAANNNPIVSYLALRGTRFKLGSFNQPAATGSQAISGVGFWPQGLLLISRNLAATATADAGEAFSIGAADAPSTTDNIWFQSQGVSGTSDANMYNDAANAITLATGTSTINAQADIQTFNRDGFRLNWGTASATARQILYWAIGRTYSDIREIYP